ncbi:hypothetical protein BACCIP111895_04558 [Neobacillus rhizosphaerae]|uniref:Uncharacterized protein n=1 Tax=Neobacillus rhizosphaerae TaxID=2880965 RepID=A0ABN8KZE1_9BACI|nr:hypothetical protein [Neobacillus rhizosphaerae]CAH2717366.1 hypothetical protein BACCIP111895_04558 [Neobacillus rhizosphaerae]
MFEFLFRVDNWIGPILKETDESKNADFFSLDNIPKGTNEFWDNHHQEGNKGFKKLRWSINFFYRELYYDFFREYFVIKFHI